MPDEPTEENEEKGAVPTYAEQWLAKVSARGKTWNNYTLIFFGLAIALLLAMKYYPTELTFGPIGSLIILLLMMLSAFISLILSALFTWRAKTLRKEIEYYSTEQEPEEENENADL